MSTPDRVTPIQSARLVVNKTRSRQFQTPPVEKGGTIPHKMCHCFLDADLLVNERDRIESNLP